MIELIGTMAIVAVLAGVAVPTLSSMGASRRAAAARQLLRDVTFARQRALSAHARCWVVCNIAGNTWSILGEDPANPGRAGATVLTDIGSGKPYTIQVGADYPGASLLSAGFDGQAEVGFDWLGRPLNAAETDLSADGSVVLSGGHIVSVARETGLVYIAP